MKTICGSDFFIYIYVYIYVYFIFSSLAINKLWKYFYTEWEMKLKSEKSKVVGIKLYKAIHDQEIILLKAFKYLLFKQFGN